MKLICLLFSLCLFLFLICSVYAQGEISPVFPAGTSGNINDGTQITLASGTCTLKSFPVLLSSSFAVDTLIREIKSDENLKQFYFQRSKNQKTTAWILLGGGTGLVIGGTIILVGDAMAYIFSMGNQGSTAAFDVAGTFIYTGIIADLVSIPFFISASHNKKLAASISCENQRTYNSPNNSFSSNIHPSLTLKIRF